MAKASDIVVQWLESEGVEYVFGIPGEENRIFSNRSFAPRSSSCRLAMSNQQASWLPA
ncbi:thiamine pyrophosphate-dependent acetolactate synthase large subunit-like protein [Pseudomonas sp. BT76 TE3572]